MNLIQVLCVCCVVWFQLSEIDGKPFFINPFNLGLKTGKNDEGGRTFSLTYPKNTYELNVDFKKKGESGNSGPFGGLFRNLFKAPAGGWFQHPFKASHSFSHSIQNPFRKTTPAPTTTTTDNTDFGGSDFGTDSDIKDIDVKDIPEEKVKIEAIPDTDSGVEANSNSGYDKNSQEVPIPLPIPVETKEDIEAGNVILDVNSLSNSGYDGNIIEITTQQQSHGYGNQAHDVSIETIPLIYLPPNQDPPRHYLPSN